MSSSRISYGWIVVATGFTMTLVGYAIRNTFTVFYPVIVEDFGWTRGITAIMYSLTMLCYGLVAPIAGGLVDRFNPKVVFAAGGLLIGGGIALCSGASEVWHFYLAYGVMVAVGLSLVGFTPLSSIITHWFPHKKAFIFGLLGAGFGVSLITAPVFQFLIAQYGWRTAYVITGIVAACIIVPVALIFMRRSPTQIELIKRAREGRTAEARPDQGGPSVGVLTRAATEWTVRTALRTRTYRLLLLMAFCNMGFAQGITIAHQVYFLRDIGYAPMTAASVFAVFGASFVAGNLSTGLSDRFGRAQVFTPGCTLAAGAFFFLYAAEGTQNAALPVLYAICAGYGLGVTPPTCFAGVADCFHGRNYGSIQGLIILSSSIGAAIGPWLGGYLHDVTGSYHSPFIVVQVLLVVAGLLMLWARPRTGMVPR